MIKEPQKTMLLFSALLFLVGTFLLLQPHLCHSLPLLLESSPSNEEKSEDKSEEVQQQQQQSSTTDSPSSPPEHPLLFSLPEYEEGGAQSSPCWNYLFGNSGPRQKKTKKGEKDQLNFWPSLKATLHGHCVREAQNAHHLPSLIYDAREYEPVRVAFCAAMYQAVGCFRRVLCTICGDLHTRYQAVFDSQNSDNLFSENQENLQLFAWNGTAYEQAMIEALEEKVPFCAGELPVKAASLKEEEESFCQTGSGLSSSALDRNFLSDVEEGVAAGVSEMESPLARLNVVFDALGQAPARFTPSANESTTAYVTPTSTYVMIVCFVVASAAFVGAIVWLMMKLNDDDRIQKENSVRPVVMAGSPKENLEGGNSSSGGVLSGGGRGGVPSGKLTKGVADGKSILTIDRKVRSKAPSRTAKLKKVAMAPKSVTGSK